MIVDEQTADDIINEVCAGHRDHTGDYDRIARYFEGGDIWEITERLWIFCKKNLPYKIESKETQNVGSPLWILTAPTIDCKNYASFIGGVLDALKRKGYRIVWYYRFVSYRVSSIWDCSPDHVFVVCNPNTDDIWVDPVLDSFNEHLFYWYKINKRIGSVRRTTAIAGIGRVGCTECGGTCGGSGAQIGTAAPVVNLLTDVSAYAQGLAGNVSQTKTTGAFNTVTEGILLGVAIAVIPGAALAIAALKAGAVALDKEFGVGSVSARLVTDISNLNVIGLVNDIFNGRTYQSDQYWAGVYYKFYVLGQNVTDPNYISDSDVPVALKWFVDKSGVMISGREHIEALVQSTTAYMALHGVNPDTTMDLTLVTAASIMAKKNWPSPGVFSAQLKGAWANTIGVYDLGLVQIANAVGQTPEQVAAETGTQDTNAASYIAAETQPANFLTASTVFPGVANWIILAAGGGLLLLLLSNEK